MAITIRLTEDVEYAGATCRLLEIKADSAEERARAIAAARRKDWFVWICPNEPNADGRWGVVLEKGMPDGPDVAGLLALVEAGVPLGMPV